MESNQLIDSWTASFTTKLRSLFIEQRLFRRQVKVYDLVEVGRNIHNGKASEMTATETGAKATDDARSLTLL